MSVDKDRGEQAENIKEARDLAHETVFDKLLAEYYLGKRDQYAKSKDLIKQLDKQFKRKEDHLSEEGIIKDPKTMNLAENIFGLEDGSQSTSNITLALMQ